MQIISTVEHGRLLSNINKITKDHVLHVYDTFDQTYVDTILKKGNPSYFVNDHFSKAKFENINSCQCRGRFHRMADGVHDLGSDHQIHHWSDGGWVLFANLVPSGSIG